MIDAKKDPFINLYKKILTPPKTIYQKDFTFSEYSYGDVFELAAGLKKTLARLGAEKTLCLCTTNKVVTAACCWVRYRILPTNPALFLFLLCPGGNV